MDQSKNRKKKRTIILPHYRFLSLYPCNASAETARGKTGNRQKVCTAIRACDLFH